MTALFQQGAFTLSNGDLSLFKIECDALTDRDWATLAWMIAARIQFSRVVGVPRGGLKLAAELEIYAEAEGPTLIVDDVLTTGASMEAARAGIDGPSVGAVVFSRGIPAGWITPLFQMHMHRIELVPTAPRLDVGRDC